jgi:polyhydroxybutyrate depolymerase
MPAFDLIKSARRPVALVAVAAGAAIALAISSDGEGGPTPGAYAAGGALRSTGARAAAASVPAWPYLIHRPASLSRSKPVPLVLAPGGGLSGAQFMENTTGLDAEADNDGFVVVYPEIQKSYNDTANKQGENPASPYPDILALSDLIDRLIQSENIDPNRVYMTGFSISATMAYRAACTIADKLAAIAPVAGVMVVPSCTPKRPISVFAVNGTSDPGAPYNGSASFPSVRAAISNWLQGDSCSSNESKSTQGLVTTEIWTQCTAATAVELVTIEGGSHVWPTKASSVYVATPPIAAFFLSHTAQPSATPTPTTTSPTTTSPTTTSPTTTKPGGGTPPGRKLVAKLRRLYTVRSAHHRRTVVMRLGVSEAVKVRVVLSRRRTTLAARSFKLSAGTATLKLPVPTKVTAGRARLTLTIVGAKDKTLAIVRTIDLKSALR